MFTLGTARSVLQMTKTGLHLSEPNLGVLIRNLSADCVPLPVFNPAALTHSCPANLQCGPPKIKKLTHPNPPPTSPQRSLWRPMFSQGVAVFLSEALTRLTDRLLNHVRTRAQTHTDATKSRHTAEFFSPLYLMEAVWMD